MSIGSIFSKIRRRITWEKPATEKVELRKDDADTAGAAPSQTNENMQVDQPIHSAKDDLFDRRGFAARVGEVIASRTDPSALVIGIYGPWGDGKTSTLNMIRETLQKTSDACTIDYNPWQFGDSQEAIVRSFWNTLGEIIDESIGKLEKGKAAVASLAKMVPYVGAGVSAAITDFSTKSIVQVRKEVSALLMNSTKRIVVFIDDIDRLERKEIQTLFRLIRLSADFPKIVYVLAFDDEIVSASLGEVYSDGGAKSGRKFLEKIVQVPLHLPPADKSALQDILFASCDRVISTAGITIGKSEGARVGSAIVGGFVDIVRTPRQAKLFDNAIAFAVPILKGEVNVGDQILIEGIRIFMPSLYVAIRENQKAFLSSAGTLVKEDVDARDAAIAAMLAEIPISDAQRNGVRRHLLEELFPRISGFSDGRAAELEWSRDKRISSSDHFRRYFVYGIPKGDIADAEIDLVVSNAAANADVATVFREAMQRKALGVFIRKLRHRDQTMPVAAAGKLLAALRSISVEIEITDSLWVGDFEFRNATILASNLLERLTPEIQDYEFKLLVDEATSILFSIDVIQWSVVSKEASDRQGWLEEGRATPVYRRIAEKVAAAITGGRILDSYSGLLGRVLGGVRYNLPREESENVRQAMTLWLASNPSDAVEVIREHTAIAHTERGKRLSDFDERGYRAVTYFVDGQLVVDLLRAQLGDQIETDKYERYFNDPDMPVELRLARQFFFLHKQRPAPASDS